LSIASKGRNAEMIGRKWWRQRKESTAEKTASCSALEESERER
jgi:hypothetical protein